MNKNMRHLLIWSIIIGLTFWFVSSVSAILLPFVLGTMMAYLLDPVVDRLEEENINRGLGTAVVTVIFFSIFVILLVALLPLVAEQMVNLFRVLPEQIRSFYYNHSAELDSFLQKLRYEQRETVQEAITDVTGLAGGVVKKVTTTLFQSGGAVLNIISLLLITPVVAFYLLRDWDGIIAKIDELLPRAHAVTIRQQLHEMDKTISGFLRGQMLVCSILATFYVIFLTIMGLNFSVVIGAAAGFLIIIPYAGWFAAAATGMIVAILQFDNPTIIAIIAVIFVMGQILESYFLTPKLVGDRVGLHPVWVIFGMLAGAVLLGFVGVLLAIPLAAIIGVLIRFAIDRYKHSELYLNERSDQLIVGDSNDKSVP